VAQVQEIASARAAEAAPRHTSVPAARPFVVEPRRSGLAQLWREFWRYRHLMPYFGKAYLQKRLARTWLGMLWLPIRPGINLATRIFVFGGLVGISTGSVPYAIFFIVATAAWQLFYETAYWSMRSIEMNRRVLSRVYVPRLTIIASALIPAAVDFLVNMGFAALATAYYVVRAHVFYLQFGLHTLLVPVGLLLMCMLGLGVGLLAGGAGAKARDFRFGVHYVFQFVYYLTPILYPITAIPNSARPFAELNPMTGAVEMVKDGLFRAHELSPDAVYVTLFWVFLIWVPGLWLFDRTQVGLLHGRRWLPWRRRPVAAAQAPGVSGS
jgi:lipopolysaccharide transport system permease protein